MGTNKKTFSNRFTLTEYSGKYGIKEDGKTVLYPIYDSISELDNRDFILEQNGKLGYAYFNEKNEIEFILSLYDVIIKEAHGVSLIQRESSKDSIQGRYFWCDTKSNGFYKNLMHIKSFIEYDLFASTKRCDKNKAPILKKWGEDKLIYIPGNESADIICEIPFGKITCFIMIEQTQEETYEYTLLSINESLDVTQSAKRKSKEEIFNLLPDFLKEQK